MSVFLAIVWFLIVLVNSVTAALWYAQDNLGLAALYAVISALATVVWILYLIG